MTSNLSDGLSVGCDSIYIVIQQIDLPFSLFRKGQVAMPKFCNVITELEERPPAENDTPNSLHVSNALSECSSLWFLIDKEG